MKPQSSRVLWAAPSQPPIRQPGAGCASTALKPQLSRVSAENLLCYFLCYFCGWHLRLNQRGQTMISCLHLLGGITVIKTGRMHAQQPDSQF
jgi:hypothetical protein